jgi:4-amino-4-deoxy-L-arabinose transferase-like glycosyltransferase
LSFNPGVDRGGERRLALWVFGAAVAIRLLYFATTHSPSFRDPLIDGDYYDFLAERIARGEGFEPGPFWQPPLYPLLLGALYRVLGHDLIWPRLLQAGLDAGSAVLAFGVARSLTKSSKFALVAGLAVALHGPMVFYSGEILPTSAAAFAALLGIQLAITHRSRWQRVAACGASIGLGALLVAPVAILIFPLAWALGKKDRRRGALALAVALGVVSSATLANWVRAGELVPISANAGINLYIGNRPDSDRWVAVRPGAEWERLANEPVERGIESLSGQDAYFLGRTASLCAGEPFSCVKRLAWKAVLLLRSREIARNEKLEVVAKDSVVLSMLTPALGPVAFPYVLLLPLAAAGIGVAFRGQKRAARVVAVSTLFMAAVPVLFFVTGRYRAELAPELAILAALGAQSLHEKWSRRRPERVAAAVVLGISVLPIHLPVDDVPFEAEMYYVIGGRRARLGDDSGAVDAWRQALAKRPDYLEAGFNLGLAYERLGDLRAAQSTFESVLAHHPDNAATRQELRALRER